MKTLCLISEDYNVVDIVLINLQWRELIQKYDDIKICTANVIV